jgi:hypothetical protein
MVFLTFAVVQFSLIMNAQSTVQYIARESARYADVNFATVGFSATNIQTYAETTLAPSWSSVPAADTTIKYYPPGATLDNGKVPPPNTMTVEVTYAMSHKYLFASYLPVNTAWSSYTYYYTTFEEGT